MVTWSLPVHYTMLAMANDQKSNHFVLVLVVSEELISSQISFFFTLVIATVLDDTNLVSFGLVGSNQSWDSD